MNGSTSVDFGERGARDGIREYCQDLDVSASEELTEVCGSVERRSGEKVAMSNRKRFLLRTLYSDCGLPFSASVVE